MFEQLKALVAAETRRTGKRRTIHLADETFRDGQQCLWATRMRTEHMLPIADRLDRAGLAGIQAMAPVQFDACVLFLKQDPFERVRLLKERFTRTPLRGSVRSNLMRGFMPVADDITDLFVERQFANGLTEIGFFDALMCADNLVSSIRTAQQLGAGVGVMLPYNLAPGYDDDFYAAKAREFVARFKPNSIGFYDAAGILTVDRLRTLIPAIKQAVGDTPLGFSTHCLTALGPWLALEAAVHGADRLLTAVTPLANGNSVPSTQHIAQDLRALGFDVRVDEAVLDEVGAYLSAVAQREGLATGTPTEFEPSHYVTQYAGGAMSNLQSSLQQAGMAEKLPAVLEEIARVRVELGSPIMVTPYPAIIGAQAVMNVVNGERYKVVADEVKKYACGYFGKLPLPVDPNVLDRVIENGSSDVSMTPPTLPPVLPGLRQRYRHLGDDELLLRYMYGDEKVNALQPTTVSDGYSLQHPAVDLLAGLASRQRKSRVHVSSERFSLSAI